MFRKILIGVSALGMGVAPVAASAVTANPASKLSVAPSARAAAPTGKTNRVGGGIGPIAAAVIGAGILIGGAVLISDHEDDDSDSN